MLMLFMIIPIGIGFLVSGFTLQEVIQYPVMIAKMPHPARELLLLAGVALNYVLYVIGMVASFPVSALLYAHFYQQKDSHFPSTGSRVEV
jgi:hypothetical protein